LSGDGALQYLEKREGTNLGFDIGVGIIGSSIHAFELVYHHDEHSQRVQARVVVRLSPRVSR
jgi:hypothetical protein